MADADPEKHNIPTSKNIDLVTDKLPPEILNLLISDQQRVTSLNRDLADFCRDYNQRIYTALFALVHDEEKSLEQKHQIYTTLQRAGQLTPEDDQTVQKVFMNYWKAKVRHLAHLSYINPQIKNPRNRDHLLHMDWKSFIGKLQEFNQSIQQDPLNKKQIDVLDILVQNRWLIPGGRKSLQPFSDEDQYQKPIISRYTPFYFHFHQCRVAKIHHYIYEAPLRVPDNAIESGDFGAICNFSYELEKLMNSTNNNSPNAQEQQFRSQCTDLFLVAQALHNIRQKLVTMCESDLDDKLKHSFSILRKKGLTNKRLRQIIGNDTYNEVQTRIQKGLEEKQKIEDLFNLWKQFRPK